MADAGCKRPKSRAPRLPACIEDHLAGDRAIRFRNPASPFPEYAFFGVSSAPLPEIPIANSSCSTSAVRYPRAESAGGAEARRACRSYRAESRAHFTSLRVATSIYMTEYVLKHRSQLKLRGKRGLANCLCRHGMYNRRDRLAKIGRVRSYPLCF
jgi:hypothetical protein